MCVCYNDAMDAKDPEGETTVTVNSEMLTIEVRVPVTVPVVNC